MTTEEKAKAYDEALERAKEWKNKYSSTISSDGTMAKDFYSIFPSLAESEDERIRKEIIKTISWIVPDCQYSIVLPREQKDKWLAYLEKQKENIEKEYVFRPLAGTDITIAAEQAIRRVNEGDRLVLAFNGWYVPVDKHATTKGLVDSYDSFIENQKERGPLTKEEEYTLHRIIEYLEDETCPSEWISLLHDIYCLPYEKQKEQKHYWRPTETDVALFNKAVTTNKTLTPTERAQLDIIRSKFGCCRASNCSGIVQKEQNPADKIEPKFNIGDTIVNKKNGEKCTIFNRSLLHQYYSDTNHCHEIKFDEQNDWELIEQKEQKPLSPEDKVKHPLYMEGFEAGKEVGRQCEKVFGKQEERRRNITANLLEDGITGVQRELIEFLANNIDASWVDVIKSADAYAQRIRSMVEKKKEPENVSASTMIPSCWAEEPPLQKEQKPFTPKYRVGDVMRTKQEAAEGITDGLPVIVSMDDDYYYCTNEKISISEQEEYEFPPMNMRQKPIHTAKEMWKEMRLEVYAQASGNRHEPNCSDNSTKMFSLCDIDEIFEKIGNSTVVSQPAEWKDLTWKDIVELEGIINNVHYDFSAGIGQESFGKEVLERFRSSKGIEYLDESEQKYWQKKQKSRINIDQLKSLMLQYLQEAANEKDDSDIQADTEKWARKILEYDFEQKSEEWSDEDEKIAKEIEEELWYPGDFPDYPSKEESELYDDCQRRLNWFKNKLKPFRLQKLDASKLENFDPVDVLNRIKKEWPMAWEKVVGKQEWSEEDKAFLKVAIAICNRYSHKDIADWLESLPERFNLQPKNEWSEEDKTIIDCAVEVVEKAGLPSLAASLKSLQPYPKQEWSEEEKEKIRQNGRLDVCYNPEKYGLCHKIEWSEEDEKNLRNLESVLYYDKHLPDETHTELGNFLKSIRPQSHKWYIKKGHWYMCIVDKPEYGWTKGKVYQSPNDNRIETDYKGDLSNWPDIEPWFRPATYDEIPDNQSHWRPSEEDIKMLEHIIGQYETGNKNSKVMGYLPRVEELSFLKKVLSKWKN